MTQPQLPVREDVEKAAGRVAGQVRRTPVLELGGDEVGVAARVVLKLELLQHAGSFKARGALHNVLTLPPDVSRVTAASGGNHGAAVAWAAARAGLGADVFVPGTSTPAKLQRIEEYGAALHRVDGDVGVALEACREFAEQHGVPLVHPYDSQVTVCGAGTVGLELAEQVPDAAMVLLACGGGGLYTGVAAALRDRVRVQPVEPELCPHLHRALAAGAPVPHSSAGVAADALGPPQIGELAYATARRDGTNPVLVGEEGIVAARRFLWERVRVLAEPAACVPLAALLGGVVRPEPGNTVVVLVSGGNNPTLP